MSRDSRIVVVDVLNNCSAAGTRHKVAWQEEFVVLCPRNPEHVMCASHLASGTDATVTCWRCPEPTAAIDRTTCHYGYVSFVEYMVEERARWPWPVPSEPSVAEGGAWDKAERTVHSHHL